MLTGGTLDRRSINCNLLIGLFPIQENDAFHLMQGGGGGSFAATELADGRVARGRIRKGKRETGCGDLLARRLERTIAPGA